MTKNEVNEKVPLWRQRMMESLVNIGKRIQKRKRDKYNEMSTDRLKRHVDKYMEQIDVIMEIIKSREQDKN
mgnify:CR=1 FL=1